MVSNRRRNPNAGGMNVKNNREEAQKVLKTRRNNSSGTRIHGGKKVDSRKSMQFAVIVLQFKPEIEGKKNKKDKNKKDKGKKDDQKVRGRQKQYKGTQKRDKNKTRVKRNVDKSTRQKDKDKNNKKKKKKKNRINRECTGTLIDANYVLTTTSCCTYCHPL